MTHTDRFVAAHRTNRAIYDGIVARLEAGAPSVKAAIEELRWSKGLKVNNIHASRYARLIGLVRPDLGARLRMRKLRTV